MSGKFSLLEIPLLKQSCLLAPIKNFYKRHDTVLSKFYLKTILTSTGNNNKRRAVPVLIKLIKKPKKINLIKLGLIHFRKRKQDKEKKRTNQKKIFCFIEFLKR